MSDTTSRFKVGDAVVLKNRHRDVNNPFNYYSPVMTVTSKRHDSFRMHVTVSWFLSSGLQSVELDEDALDPCEGKQRL